MTKTQKGGAGVQLQQLPMNELAQQLRQRLDSEGSACLLVTGCSMVPMLRNGRDTVTLVPVTGPLRAGDVIFYQRSDSQLVLHRIIRVTDTGLVCSGDHQHIPEAVQPNQVLAVVSCFERGGKRYGVSDLSYRLYSAVTTAVFPIRRPLLALRKAAGKVKRALRSK